MKICWKNLEGVYLSRTGSFRKKGVTYIINTCGVCAEEYLKDCRSKTSYCSYSCSGKDRKLPVEFTSWHASLKGSNSPSWKHDLTNEHRLYGRHDIRNKEWAIAVKKRDKVICQCCGESPSGKMVSHHKYSYADYPELRYDIENGITLCKECHTKFHKEFGYGKNTKQQLYRWLLEYN